jgi:hypothetical protein
LEDLVPLGPLEEEAALDLLEGVLSLDNELEEDFLLFGLPLIVDEFLEVAFGSVFCTRV